MVGHLIEMILPPIISGCELIGIFVVTRSALQAFWHYLKGLLMRESTDFKMELAEGLAAGLEFKMASEILKTVLVQTVDELVVLGAVILLRALLSWMIHMELKLEHAARRESMERQVEEKRTNRK